MLNIVVVRAMPMVRASAATMERAGLWISDRKPYRMSRKRAFMGRRYGLPGMRFQGTLIPNPSPLTPHPYPLRCPFPSARSDGARRVDARGLREATRFRDGQR